MHGCDLLVFAAALRTFAQCHFNISNASLIRYLWIQLGSKFSDSESFQLVVYYTDQAHPYSRPSVGMAIHSEVWKSDQE